MPGARRWRSTCTRSCCRSGAPSPSPTTPSCPTTGSAGCRRSRASATGWPSASAEGGPMVHLPLRTVAIPEATARVHDAWIGELEERLAEGPGTWNRLARDLLLELTAPDVTDYDERVADPAVPLARREAL